MCSASADPTHEGSGTTRLLPFLGGAGVGTCPTRLICCRTWSSLLRKSTSWTRSPKHSPLAKTTASGKHRDHPVRSRVRIDDSDDSLRRPRLHATRDRRRRTDAGRSARVTGYQLVLDSGCEDRAEVHEDDAYVRQRQRPLELAQPGLDTRGFDRPNCPVTPRWEDVLVQPKIDGCASALIERLASSQRVCVGLEEGSSAMGIDVLATQAVGADLPEVVLCIDPARKRRREAPDASRYRTCQRCPHPYRSLRCPNPVRVFLCQRSAIDARSLLVTRGLRPRAR